MNTQLWFGMASILLALGVGAGAFGAHALKGVLDTYASGIYEKAVFYHFVHALGMLIVVLGTKVQLIPETVGARASLLLLVGVLLFSGSLYGLALSGWRLLGMVTPFGGTAFILAWGYLAIDSFRRM